MSNLSVKNNKSAKELVETIKRAALELASKYETSCQMVIHASPKHDNVKLDIKQCDL